MPFANFDIASILSSIIAIVISITVHEFGHAFAAHLLGDDTAKESGRMSLNPMEHIDLIGIIMLFVFHFGWAKPVPVNPNNYKNYKVGNFIVSVAGIFFNIVLAVICIIINKYTLNIYSVNLVTQWIILYCIGLASFNIIPIPPLDGWGVLKSFLPSSCDNFVNKFESIGFIILLIILLTNVYTVILNPIYNVIFSFVLLFS